MLLFLNLPNFLGKLPAIAYTHAPFLTLSRYHVGESLIPSVRRYMRFIGAEEKLANHGFVLKVLATLFLLNRPF